MPVDIVYTLDEYLGLGQSRFPTGILSVIGPGRWMRRVDVRIHWGVVLANSNPDSGVETWEAGEQPENCDSPEVLVDELAPAVDGELAFEGI